MTNKRCCGTWSWGAALRLATDTGGPAGVSPWGCAREARGAGGSTPHCPLFSPAAELSEKKIKKPPQTALNSPRVLLFPRKHLVLSLGCSGGSRGTSEMGGAGIPFLFVLFIFLNLIICTSLPLPGAHSSASHLSSSHQRSRGLKPLAPHWGPHGCSHLRAPVCVLAVPLPHPRGRPHCFNGAFPLINVPQHGAIGGWFRVSPLLFLQCCDTESRGSCLPFVMVHPWVEGVRRVLWGPIGHQLGLFPPQNIPAGPCVGAARLPCFQPLRGEENQRGFCSLHGRPIASRLSAPLLHAWVGN